MGKGIKGTGEMETGRRHGENKGREKEKGICGNALGKK